jgi:mannose-6-phosphate isomerase-like protein (cupin superfamily)
MREWAVFALALFACDAGSGKRDEGSGTAATSAETTSSHFPLPASPNSVEFYPAGDLARIGSNATGGKTFGIEHPTFHYVEARRDASGSPEIHDQWVDVTIVQAGRATLLSGGTVNGGSVTEPGEHRGGTIAGGASHAIQAGDMFVVPAGTPHQFQLGRGDTIRYLTIKIAK